MKWGYGFCGLAAMLVLAGCGDDERTADAKACVEMVRGGLRPIADDPSQRFLGKVEEATARCRGGDKAVDNRAAPWVDWSNYWATGDAGSKKQGAEARTRLGEHIKPNGRGIDGALMDLEYQRIELIKFNLFDNYTYESYVKGLGGKPGSGLTQWDAMRLTADHPAYAVVGGDGPQLCAGELVRHRTLTGICNDVWNPKMGSTGTLFARNAAFEATFPRLAANDLARARHSDPENGLRIGLMKPDPQLVSRKLFTRQQDAARCRQGQGLLGHSTEAECAYQQAPFFNVLAAFWIQFMTHDWFSHLEEGRNRPGLVPVGCEGAAAQEAGCRPGDAMERSLYAEDTAPGSFEHDGSKRLKRAHKTTANTVTAWWDASQIYGYDELSLRRVVRDPADRARLLQPEGYLPGFESCLPECSVQPQWRGQEATAFPDNWNIGLSFYHNLFVREHNSFVAAFRERQRATPDRDSGLRNPARPQLAISYADASDEEIYQAARLVVSAMIAKIHTIEWTTQLLYDEPLYQAMNSNWFGLFDLEEDPVSKVLKRILDRDQNLFSRASATVAGWLGGSNRGDKANAWYSVLASGAGIFGLNNAMDDADWDITDPTHLNAGVNHFGSPFNFPEEFTTVYRLHPLLPDLIDYREVGAPNAVTAKIPVTETVRAGATSLMRDRGLENWALSMGRQRLGVLHLQNHPAFLQNLPMPHLGSQSGKLDIAALDLIRDRERGVPRFNEFRRQIGLKSLSGFDDFIDRRLPEDSPARAHQREMVELLREVYGTHTCEAGKVITDAQRDADGAFIDDCLGHPDGTVVDNIEDLDVVVGMLAEYPRPHGFAISETQFHIFIINASRRLFSDRFFTSGFRPEFYSHLGYDWVLHNGPPDDCPYALSDGACNEPEPVNGHAMQVAPLKRVLMRNVPELREELLHVVNAFDPWARDRGEYYSLEWQPRAGAEDDPAFAPQAR